MRLLHCKERTIHEFVDDQYLPPYAILSHTWGEQEVSFSDLQNDSSLLAVKGDGHAREGGINKINSFCEIVQDIYDMEYCWIDTCCIDKSSSAELSEAINSMYRWYANSMVCIVYLVDVSWKNEDAERQNFQCSRWFTRGWTLQELIAPPRVTFFDGDWNECGSREGLQEHIFSASGIPSYAYGKSDLNRISVAERMCWASRRKTTRSEDMAYSLLGLFDVNMPLLYGEGGQKAFHRLQVEIMRQIPDETLFAWEPLLSKASWDEERGMLAKHPYEFSSAAGIESKRYLWRKPFFITHLGVQIELDLHNVDRYEDQVKPLIEKYGKKALRAAALRCVPSNSTRLYVIILKGDGHLSFTRVGYLVKSPKLQLGPMTEVHVREPF